MEHGWNDSEESAGDGKTIDHIDLKMPSEPTIQVTATV